MMKIGAYFFSTFILTWLAGSGAWAAPTVEVIIGTTAPKLEQFAAGELARYLDQLFGVSAQLLTEPSPSPQALFLIGSPATNATVKQASTSQPFPDVTDQGIVLRRANWQKRPALIVGGGSPRATLWAVYELAERWGVRYLVTGDVLPGKRDFQMPDLSVVMEPLLRVRAHPTIQDFASSGESWGAADFRRLFDQLAKLKFSRMNIYAYGWQPYLHYELKGIKRRSAWLWYDYHYPITEDMVGRELFGDVPEFWNPDLPFGASYEQLINAGQQLVQSLIEHAHSRGMEVALAVPTTDFTPEFAPLLEGAERSRLRSGLTIVPGVKTALDDPQIEELARTVLAATMDTYPEADYLTVWMPEVRQWTGEYERAWQALDDKYRIGEVLSLEKVFSTAQQRKGLEVPIERLLNELKGDIASLYFYERLLQGSHLLEGTRHSNVKFIYWGVSEELFPILDRILPSGWEVGVMPANQPTHLLERLEILADLPEQIPGVLDLTLDDDNIGMVPQLTPNSLRKIVQVMKRNGWAGFVARERFSGDHDWPLAYLSRAAWHQDVDPNEVARDQLRAVCGEACAEEMITAFHEIESVTTFLADSNSNFSKERPGTFMKYWRPWPVPTYLAGVRAGYGRALNAVGRARLKSTPAGFDYLDFWSGRLEFALRFTEAVEFLYRAAAAEMADDYRGSLGYAEQALTSLRRGLEAYARIARNQTDRGAIAMLNEFAYRPLKAKADELTRLVKDSQ